MTEDQLPPGVAPATPTTPAPTAPPIPDTPKPGFNFGTYLAAARKEEEAALLPPGRYNLTVSDARVPAEPNDKGLFYGVFQCNVDGAEIALIGAIDISDELKGADGMPDSEKLNADPMVKKQFLSGLAQLEKLQAACGITPEELSTAESADDLIALFIGARFKAIVSKGTDQYGLPNNTIRKILGKADDV